jgi:ligand-binding sensor domain-containing protein
MSIIFKRFILLACILVFIFNSLANSLYHTRHYKVADGLPSNIINSICFNSSHQLILGTQRGIAIFDGYKFSAIDSSNRIIESIINNNQQVIFNQNGSGIGIYNSHINTFKQYIIRPQYNDSDPNNDHFNNLYLDHQQNIWCSDYQFIKKINLEGEILETFQIHANANKLISQFIVLDNYKPNIIITNDTIIHATPQLILDIPPKRDGIWKLDNEMLCFTARQELVFYNYNNFKTIHKQTFKYPVFSVQKFETDFWITTEHAVYKLNINSEELTLIYENQDIHLKSIAVDTTTQIIWIASNNGLIQLTPNNTIYQYFSLPTTKQKTFVKDIIALGTQTYVLQSNIIHIYNNYEYQTSIHLNNNNAQHFIKHNDILYVITTNAVYQIIDHKLKELPLALQHLNIKKALITLDEELWLMQESDIIYRYDLKTLPPIKTIINNDSFFWNKNKWNDIKEVNGKIWMVGWMPKSFGVVYYDKKLNQFIDIATQNINDNSLFVGDYFNWIGTSKDGNLLLSAYGGFNILKQNGTIIKRIDILTYPIHSDVLHGIVASADGTIYFGTSDGLYVYNVKKDAIYGFTEKQGLPQNDVTHAFHLVSDSFLLIGMNNGWCKVHLNKLTHTQLVNRLQITNIQLDNSFINSNETIHFNPKNSNLTINFSALTYQNQEQIQYRYKYSFDDKWINLGNQSNINLNHLPFGDYDLTIQSGDYFDNWSKDAIILKINSTPPFTKSRLFYALIVSTAILIITSIAIYIINKSKKEHLLQQKSIKNEMSALRAQMNPHFIFNSLNALHSYILQEKSDEASSYLTSFAKLLRYILAYSRKELIPIEDELKALKLYLKLEAARLEHKFDYEFDIDTEIDTHEIMIPPLIIQPFAENAIWHGIRNINYQGIISITIQQTNEVLSITITDNGIGREKASLHKNEFKKDHFGVSIANERVKLLHPQNAIHVTDLNTIDPKGTKVTILLYNT